MSQAQGQQNGKHNAANLKRACSLALPFQGNSLSERYGAGKSCQNVIPSDVTVLIATLPYGFVEYESYSILD